MMHPLIVSRSTQAAIDGVSAVISATAGAIVFCAVFCVTPQRVSAQPAPSFRGSTPGPSAYQDAWSVPQAPVADSLYPEEAQEKAGFAYLMRRLPRETRFPDDPLPTPDTTRFDMPVSFDARTQAAIRALQTVEREIFASWLNRLTRYRPMALSILSRDGLPKDLMAVALIASGFNPRAYDEPGTAGLWQVELATADQYGLDRTAYVDERYDPEKSTKAIAQQFRALFRQFGSWDLAISAYHTGSARVEAALAARDTRDVWQLDLPDETRRFLTLVMAAVVIMKEPAAYGFEVTSLPPLTFETVPVGEDHVLQEIADGCQISVEQLRILNPELRAWKAPAGYTLKIPVGTQPQYRTWAGLPPLSPTPADMMAYKVRRGDTITSVARRFGLAPEEIALENDLLVKSKLKKGRVLFIPIYDRPPTPSPPAPQDVVSESADSAPAGPAPSGAAPEPGVEKITHKVKRGDTLASIGRRYRVSIEALQSWNHLKNAGAILIGQKLTILKPVSGAVTGKSQKPATTPTGVAAVTYTVKRGDTLWDIARQFNITLSAIRTANNLTRRSAIHPGDRLKIVQPVVK